MTQVSVCVISYNFEKYISKAMDSIVEQKTNFDFEIIVCDDGSSDNTQEILIEYKKRYPELIKLVLLPENTRGKDTLIKAIEQVKGKYVAILDGDDFWCNDKKLQMQFDFMESNPNYSAVVTHLNAVNETGTPIKMPALWSKNIQKDFFTIKDFEEKPISPFIQSIFYRNREEYIDFYRTKSCMDNFIQAMLLSNGDIGILPDITATYRIVRHNGSNYSSMSIAKKAERLFNCGLCIEESFGDKINIDHLMEGYLADTVVFGLKTMNDDQKQYIINIPVKRKFKIVKRIITGNLKRFINLFF